jgi:hypothetical protein
MSELLFREATTQLDARNMEERLAALMKLRGLEQRGALGPATPKIGPALPSYDHVHTNASYGDAAPGVYSAARMVWAAHEARAFSILSVEHESVAHMDEAIQATTIVNRGMTEPLRLALAVEFKAPIALNDAVSKKFSDAILKTWGQGEAAWVVAVGARRTPELERLVRQFQKAKRVRSEQQLEKLNRHLKLSRPLKLSSILTPEGNITDRQLTLAVARAELGDVDEKALAKRGGEVRRMLNPGGPAYAPFPPGLPVYQELVGLLARWGTLPTFTAQLREQTLEEFMPTLKSWGMAALDTAGIEPYEPNAARDIATFVRLAELYGLAFYGGSDYRGVGTGWQEHAPWMDHPLIRTSIERVAHRF